MITPSAIDIRRRRFAKAEALRNQWLTPDPEQVQELQLKRLQQVWRDVTQNVPYFKRLVTQKRAPSDFNTIGEFTSGVPILTRAQIVAEPELFVRLDRGPDRKGMTAGSTGNPLHFGIYNKEAEQVAPDLVLGRVANGLTVSDRVFLLWGHSHLLGAGLKGKAKNAIRKFKDRVLGYRRVDAYHLDRSSSRSHMRSLLRFRPSVLIGYSSALDLFVRHNEDMALEARALGMKFVVGTSENLPRTDSQKTIEDFFGCPFLMEYGGVEFGSVGHNMPGEPYRVYWWNALVETLTEEETPGTEGEPVVVTALYSRYFPVIRYRNGDEIKGSKKLEDGQVLQFDEVCGRYNDGVTLDDGSQIHSVGLFHCIQQESQVFNIQLVIEKRGLRLLLVSPKSDAGVVTRIRRRLHDLNPALSNCVIEFVPDLITNRAGKRRWIIDAR